MLSSSLSPLYVRDKRTTDYVELWQQMKTWTRGRTQRSEDECWVTSHLPVFTLGQAGDKGDLLANPRAIPVVHSDRGGQITYHGPGQIIFYLLLDLHRRQLTVRNLVWATEEIVIKLLAEMNVLGHRRQHMPGVYVRQAKIAAIGFRIHKGCSYHGISLNHELDLDVFKYLNPCGYKDLKVTSIANEGIQVSGERLQSQFLEQLATTLDYNITHMKEDG